MFFPKSTLVALTLAALAQFTSAAPLEGDNNQSQAPIVARAFTGDMTYYNTGLGACGKTSNDNQLVVALNKIKFDPKTPNGNPNKNTLCGKKIKVNYQGKSVTVTIVDRCPGCKANDLDLSPAAFKKLAPLEKGRIKATWDYVN
ncbi:RlpA-like double-psi beta-barrel-protein domain-containing protein-containing protein [Podospora australis]|uniref:RlpA-like double-psi beta-barrel-protein domain-containing protein-containing protein n=1 Tax=Podospora australis TaxID=1536484 RepID=A0AAN6X319_9PEZI|nr:RlpA-like double-psi beta-barrel-protein domain-containing protein-containing protein [Podospora australis]